MTEQLLRARELGEMLGLSTATVLDWFEADRLPGFRLGGRKRGPVRFRLAEVEAVLEEWRCGPAPCREPQEVLMIGPCVIGPRFTLLCMSKFASPGAGGPIVVPWGVRVRGGHRAHH